MVAGVGVVKKERIHELEQQQRKYTKNILSKASGTCGTITKYLMLIRDLIKKKEIKKKENRAEKIPKE